MPLLHWQRSSLVRWSLCRLIRIDWTEVDSDKLLGDWVAVIQRLPFSAKRTFLQCLGRSQVEKSLFFCTELSQVLELPVEDVGIHCSTCILLQLDCKPQLDPATFCVFELRCWLENSFFYPVFIGRTVSLANFGSRLADCSSATKVAEQQPDSGWLNNQTESGWLEILVVVIADNNLPVIPISSGFTAAVSFCQGRHDSSPAVAG